MVAPLAVDGHDKHFFFLGRHFGNLVVLHTRDPGDEHADAETHRRTGADTMCAENDRHAAQRHTYAVGREQAQIKAAMARYGAMRVYTRHFGSVPLRTSVLNFLAVSAVRMRVPASGNVSARVSAHRFRR